MTLDEMREELRKLVEELDGLKAKAEKEGLSEEEDKRFDEALERSDQLKASIEKAEKRESKYQEVTEFASAPQSDFDPRALQSDRYSPNAIPRGAQDPNEWRSLGEFVQAVALNPTDPRLQDRHVELRQPPPQQQTVGEAGGFLVPDTFSDQLLTVQPDEAIIRPRATAFPADGDGTFRIPAIDYDTGNNMYGGATVDWIDEGETKEETEVHFRQIQLTPFEVAAHIPVTDRLLRNSGMVEQIVRSQLRGALIDAEEREFLRGAGGDRPLGIIDHASTIQVDRQDNNEIQFDDVAGMYEVFRGRRGVWVVSRDVLPELMRLQDENDHFIWMANAREGSPGTLFGMPVLFSDHSPQMDTSASVVLADLSYYLIKDGVGITIAASPHQFFTQNRTVIKAFKTVDGRPWLNAALPTNITTSPFVQLQNV